MNELIKAQYRNSDLKDEAYEIAAMVFELIPASELLSNPDMLSVFCKTASLSIIQNSVKTFKKNIDAMLKKRDRKMDAKDTENIIKEMSGLFIDEMDNTASVCMSDLMIWANKAVTMGAGSDRIGQTLSAAWATKTPPLFTDFNQRVKQAIDGYINSVFQMLVLSNAD
jgi:hypothetical protein